MIAFFLVVLTFLSIKFRGFKSPDFLLVGPWALGYLVSLILGQPPHRSLPPSSNRVIQNVNSETIRFGGVARSVVVMLLSLAVLGALVASMVRSPKPDRSAKSSEPLVIYCAASNKSVLEAIRQDYEEAYGVPLHIQYGASQTLLHSANKYGTKFPPCRPIFPFAARASIISRASTSISRARA